MQKIADISRFEQLMKRAGGVGDINACHNTELGCFVFNSLERNSAIKGVLDDYGCTLIDKGNHEYWVEFDEAAKEILHVLELADDYDAWWARRNLNYESTLKERGICKQYADVMSGWENLIRNGFPLLSFVVRDGGAYNQSHCIDVISHVSYKPITICRVLGDDVEYVEENLKRLTPKMYGEVLNELQEKLSTATKLLKATKQQADKWKERRATLEEEELKRTSKINKTVATKDVSWSDYMDVPNPEYDDSYID